MGINKEKLVFDTSVSLDENDNLGAFLRGADGTLITHTNEGGKDALDVHISNASIVVTATDLDIRDLAFATDKVDASGSVVALDAPTLAALESITVQNGAGAAAVNIQDGGNSITVDAVDLDIRDLSHTQDSVKIGDGTDFLAINADGSINVNADISVVNGAEKAEDAASANGDIGQYVLQVRQDTLAVSTSADGDYQSFKGDNKGALWVHPTITPTPDAPNTALLAQAVVVSDTAVALPTSALAARKKLLIQNLSNKAIEIGDSSVTFGAGVRIAAGGNYELEVGPGLPVYAIAAAAGSNDVRVLEVA
jgi:hypothetical protein